MNFFVLLAAIVTVLEPGFANEFYYSAMTYTALGFGDITPTGPLRLFTAIESDHRPRINRLDGLGRLPGNATVLERRRTGITTPSEVPG